MIEHRYPTTDTTRDARPAAVSCKIGKGNVAVIPGPLGTDFAMTHAPALRQFLKRVTAQLFRPTVALEGPATVELSLRRKAGKLLVNLVNTTAMQVSGEYAAIDFVPPVNGISLSLRLERKPSRVTVYPAGRPLSGGWQNGMWKGTLDLPDIHTVVAFEGA